MSVTHPTGLSHSVNRTIVLATLLFSVSAFAVLLVMSLSHQHSSGFESVIYGFSLLTCSFFSYLYNTRPSWVPAAVLRQLDHAAIFLLIAGTYTPFAVSQISGPFGIRLLWWVWGLAVIGITLRLAFRKGYDRLFVGLYVLMGWSFVWSMPAIIHTLPGMPLIFLGLGALMYSLGAVIFARDIGRWTDPVWHACVLGAAGFHFVAVIDLVLRPTT